MRVLVTGGAGFIGSNTAEYLLASGHEVRIFDDLSSGKLANLSGLDVDFIKGDIRRPEKLSAAMKGCDAVLHLAALVSVPESVRSPRMSHDINATGTFNVLSAAREAGVRRVVSASSAAVYGNLPGSPKKESMSLRAESPYAAGKLSVEHYSSVFSSVYGLETVCLRYFNVFGPRQNAASQYSGVISRFSAALSAGEPLTVFGDGGQTRDFVYVADVARANTLALTAAKAGKGEAVNIASGRSVSLLSLAGAMGTVLGKAPRILFRPAREGDIRRSLADISFARRLLGYRPAYGLEQGLGLTLSAALKKRR